jgi:hypothetical protein
MQWGGGVNAENPGEFLDGTHNLHEAQIELP